MQQDLRSLHPATGVRRAEGNDSDLEARLRASYSKLTLAETKLTHAASVAAELKEQLVKRESELEALKATPSIKIKADKKLLMDALLLKDQELTAVKEQLKDLQHKHNLLVLEKAATQGSAAIPVDNSKKPAPVLKEQVAGANPLQEELALAKEAIKIAEARAKAAEEKYASREIKQDAIDEVIQKRDTKIETLITQVQALKNELAAEKATQEKSLAQADDATSAKIVAEKELKATADEINTLHVTVKDLVSDIKSAKAMVERKSRDHDATLKELRRLSDILDQKKEELNNLQRRVSGSVKKAPAEDIKVKAPDCFKDCTPKVK
jgi:chromosome segregation ATPase